MTTAPTGDEPVEYGISYRGADVRVQVDSAALAEGLRRQFLAYGARVVPPEPGAALVSTRRASSRSAAPGWEHIRIHGGGDAVAPRGATLLTGPPFSVVSVSKPDISILRCDDEAHLPFTHHMVKYPLRHTVERRGGVLAHSAAVEVGPDSCALFLGQSGAGKTTVFLELVTRGFGALGNDSTLLEPAGGVVHAAAWPHILRIGEGTAAHNAVLGTLPTDWAPRSAKDGKYEFFFDTLDDILGRATVGAPGPVTVVVDLAIDLTGTGFAVERLSADVAMEVVGRLLVMERLPTGWLPGWSWEPDMAAVRTVADLLLASAPVYRARLGVADPRWADRLGDWLKNVTGVAA